MNYEWGDEKISIFIFNVGWRKTYGNAGGNA